MYVKLSFYNMKKLMDNNICMVTIYVKFINLVCIELLCLRKLKFVIKNKYKGVNIYANWK